MIGLNLIPPEKKKEVRLMQLYVGIKNLIISLLLLSIIVAVILLFVKMTLQNNFDKVVAETTLTTKYINTFNNDIKKFNQLLGTVDNIQKNYIPWSTFIAKFSKLIPPNITLQSINIKDSKVLITGRAKTREDLLNLKNNLESSTFFSNSQIPLEDLLKKENINFSLKSDIDFEKIKSNEN
ncbi:MAG: PilN domain-containing protein [Patescibacteria group bacterium]|nr:PilN domain-containing protein [Patescibacteria group bacterium]